MAWWHYTVGTTVLQIIADHKIARAHLHLARGERKAVWFSCRETWEPTATKGRIGADGSRRHATAEEMVHAGGALARIQVSDEVARHTWKAHRQIGGVDPRVADKLEESARNHGADPAEWRVSYHDVPTTKCLRVEASNDGEHWTVVGEFQQGEALLDPGFVDQVRAALARRSEKGGA